MADIADFLAARIYDDEQRARAALDDPWLDREDTGRWEATGAGVEGDCYFSIGSSEEPPIYFLTDGQAEHIASWDPARALLECQAKRGILLDYMTRKRRAEVDRHAPAPSTVVLEYLALPYKDHPDYRPAAWTPPEPGTVELWGRR